MTVTEHPTVTAASRRGLLLDFARAWDTTPHGIGEIVLRLAVHPTFDEPLAKQCTCGLCLSCLWDALCWDLSLADGLEHQPWATPRCPTDINPRITGPGAYEKARDEIWMRVYSTADVLLDGRGNQPGTVAAA